MSGCHDFDFVRGRWTVKHRRLRKRGLSSTEWDDFDGTVETRLLLGGLCNIEEHRIPGQDCRGIALRTFDRTTGLWSIYWVSERSGKMEPPVVGAFKDGLGTFEGEDRDGERPVRVGFVWDSTNPDEPRWRQSFSYDGGTSWELNWTMDFQRD